MAQYRVKELSFIGNRLVQTGETVEYDGKAGKNLEAVKAKKEKGGSAGSGDQGEPQGEPEGGDLA